MFPQSRCLSVPLLRNAALVGAFLALGTGVGSAKPFIKDAFIDYYPNAAGSILDDVPGKTDHCGVCHYNVVDGGGPRTPYGDAISTLGSGNVKKNQIAGYLATLGPLDSDGDGHSSDTEVNSVIHINTPTFPGLNTTNFAQVVASTAQLDAMSGHLTPLTSVDNTPPTVVVTVPNGGETWSANEAHTVTWVASDASGIAAVHIYESLDDGATYTPVAIGVENTGSYSWIPSNRPTTTARIRVVAIDNALNTNDDVSDNAFSIVPPTIVPAPPVPTTLRDFDMPGSQPFEGGPEAADPSDCAACHGDYDPEVEPYYNWQGSMMALASLDPLFLANMTIANQDAPESGDLCLRCHDSRGWLEGRSVPTDGSSMEEEDLIGVSCDLCHRMVDPVYDAGIDPARDAEVLADLSNPGTEIGNGMFVLDPSAIQRGPFADARTPHQFVESPFHREAAMCGTCHDVSNPAFTRNLDTGIYEPNAFDAPATDFSPHSMAPVERTYSEWLNSEYNTPTGVLAPEFAGNKGDGTPQDGYVSTCQDCHMRDVTGEGCNLPSALTRDDLPLHDMTGGTTWLAPLIANMHPTKVNAAAVADGVDRATEMLEKAATLEIDVTGGNLVVTVTNQTGHKLPTGYPEGRRIWINVKFYDETSTLISESCAYDASTGVLSHDPEAKIYEVHPGIGDNIDEVVGLPVGPSLHFVLNNEVFEDNRIPPRGFTNAAYEAFGGAPVGHAYADGQYWDETPYAIPAGAMRAEVKLYYQSTSKEFVEFLRDENTTDNTGQEMYDLWNNNGKCPPVEMEELEWMADPVTFAGVQSATPGVESATLAWAAATSSCPPVTYSVYQSTSSGGQAFGTPVMTTTDTSAVVPLNPGTVSQMTYFFVIRATDGCGGSEANTVELSVQPLLDPAGDQDSDGMPNGFEEQYSLDPFSLADALTDPDRDGLTCLEEAAYGSDPNDADSAHHPAPAEFDDGGTVYFAMTYTRVKGLTTATIAAEVSSDLQTWNSGAAHITVASVVDNGDGTETVVERMNTPMSGAPHEFMRLGVTAAP